MNVSNYPILAKEANKTSTVLVDMFDGGSGV